LKALIGIKFSLVLSILFSLGIWASTKVKLLLVHSESLPYRAMVLVKGSPYKKGDYVTVEHHRPLYLLDEVQFTKQVAGLPGDQVKIGALHPQNHQGQKLTPLKVATIPEGYVFLKGEHPDSYDSRYEEFGLVKTEHIVGRTWPLF